MRDGMFVFDSKVCVSGSIQTPWGFLGVTIEDWIKRMDRNGIDFSLIMNIYSIIPEEQRLLNDKTADNVKKFSDRLMGFIWASPLWGEKALDEMKHGAEMGHRGLKLYPTGHGGFPLDSVLLDPIMELAKKLGWVVMAHTDVDSKICHPLLGARLGMRHPEVPLILTNMGMNSDVTHFIPDYVKDFPNVYLCTSDTPNLPEFVYKTPMKIIPDRMLFGSGGPSLSPEVELKKIDIADKLYGLSKEEKKKILGINAAKLFGLKI